MFSKLSPSFARKGHQQLTCSDADEKDRVIAGVQYSVRYIGSAEVAGASGTGSGKTEKPVATVFEEQRKNGNGKTQKKMILNLCSKRLSVSEEASGKLIANFPISKVTFCNIDNFHEKAFVFIARDRAESPFKAFVFTCESKAKARELFKALSLAFTINYESYQASLARGLPSNTMPVRNDEGKSTFLDGIGGECLDGAQPAKAKAEHLNGALISRKESPLLNVNGFRSVQVTIPKTMAPKQNKNLLRVADCRLRSASDPPHGFKANASIVSDSETRPSSLHPSKMKKGDEMEEEFTEFAELRSKCRSNSALVAPSSRHPGNMFHGFQSCDSAPNVWGSFQNYSRPTIYWILLPWPNGLVRFLLK